MAAQAGANGAAARLRRVQEIAASVAGPHADDVDREARFPKEAVDALRGERLLSAPVPQSLGGLGASFDELAHMCRLLGAQCAASAMVFAMHQIQLLCVVRHAAGSDYFRDYLRKLVDHQWLIASVTSEVGIGGDMRSSLACVEASDQRFSLTKQATTISYGAHADDLLVTARRAPEAPPSDQVLVLLRRGQFELQNKGAWDTLGMRGTCSPPFEVRGQGELTQVIPDFSTVASATMVPCSHALWSAVWLGIASDAVARARAMVRAQARKTPGSTPPAATRLAEVNATLEGLSSNLQAFVADYQTLTALPDRGLEALASFGFALRANQLKVNMSEGAVDVVSRVLPLCGIAGYRNDTPQSVGRHLRDVHSSVLMIANSRILATNAQLLLVHKAT